MSKSPDREDRYSMEAYLLSVFLLSLFPFTSSLLSFTLIPEIPSPNRVISVSHGLSLITISLNLQNEDAFL